MEIKNTREHRNLIRLGAATGAFAIASAVLLGFCSEQSDGRPSPKVPTESIQTMPMQDVGMGIFPGALTTH